MAAAPGCFARIAEMGPLKAGHYRNIRFSVFGFVLRLRVET